MLTPRATSATMAVTVMSVLFCTGLPSILAGYRSPARSSQALGDGLACASMGSLNRLAEERTDLAPVRQAQVAATVAALLGEDFVAASPRSAPPVADVLGR